MKIAISTLPGAPDSMETWSGTPANFLPSLSALHPDIALIGPLKLPLYKALNGLSGVSGLIKRKVNWEVEPSALKRFTVSFDRKVAKIRPDVVIAMGWTPYRSTSEVPIIYWGDATIAQRIGKSPHWSGLSKRTALRAAKVEETTLQSFSATVWASEWARSDAETRYNLQETECVPFASNIADPGPRSKVLPAKGVPIPILAVGVKWHRKGLDIAVETVDLLAKQGLPVHLHIVGTNPPDASWNRDNVTYHGFLSKTIPEQANLLHSLYSSSSLFLLPTRNEPFGIVFQEAAAYGMPVVSCHVGGVPEVVEHGVTGFLLPEGSAAPTYAPLITNLTTSPGLYDQMSRAARRRYESQFSWSTPAASIHAIAQRVVTSKPAHPDTIPF